VSSFYTKKYGISATDEKVNVWLWKIYAHEHETMDYQLPNSQIRTKLLINIAWKTLFFSMVCHVMEYVEP
jgi:hypothetical protein